MIAKFLNSKTKTVTFTATLLGISALISRLLGLFRDNLLANLFTKAQTDIYFAAFRIPDFIYGILITGGIVAAFLPVFSEYFKQSKREAQILTNNVLNCFLIILVILCSILAIFTPQLINLIVPGFTVEQKTLTISLTRIIFLSPILLGISAIFSGILQYFNLFFAYALAPIFYNLGIILGILCLTPIFGLKGLALGVILGAFFHLFIQLVPAVKHGFKPTFSFNFRHPGLRKIFKLMAPRTLGSASYHINLIVITAIASTLAQGSIRIFNFANNLQGVAVGLVGLPFATAAFPFFSRHFANNEKEKFLKSFSRTFSQILFLIIPLSILVFLLRAQIVRIILGTSILGKGLFDWWDTRLTAASLGIFSAALFASCLIPLLSRAFFAQQDTKTPVKIALGSMALNIIFSFSFVKVLSYPNIFQAALVDFLKLQGVKDISIIGLPLALSLATLFQFFLLSFYLKRKIEGLNFKEVFQKLLKVLTGQS
jgi:putative peptidoglycan lipid II flippase